jgi:hypothetical protein
MPLLCSQVLANEGNIEVKQQGNRIHILVNGKDITPEGKGLPLGDSEDGEGGSEGDGNKGETPKIEVKILPKQGC